MESNGNYGMNFGGIFLGVNHAKPITPIDLITSNDCLAPPPKPAAGVIALQKFVQVQQQTRGNFTEIL